MTEGALGDVGERRLVREVVSRYVEAVGDDCGLMEVGTSWIAVTTDPVPRPAALLIGGDDDLFWVGWLLVTINASDLAASGADPLAFVAAMEAPPTLGIDGLERLLAGARESCQVQGLRYIGGNLREGVSVSAVGTAIGAVHDGKPIRRSGARDGDLLVSVGQGGVFWRDALKIRRQLDLPDKLQSPVFRPRSQIHIMKTLRRAGLVRAAIDNSDGLLPSIGQLAERSECGCVVLLDSLRVPGCDVMADVDEARLWMGWGDWNVICAVGKEQVPELVALAAAGGVATTVIGRCLGDAIGVFVERAGRRLPAPRIESERFAVDSWFVKGIDAYVEALLKAELP